MLTDDATVFLKNMKTLEPLPLLRTSEFESVSVLTVQRSDDVLYLSDGIAAAGTGAFTKRHVDDTFLLLLFTGHRSERRSKALQCSMASLQQLLTFSQQRLQNECTLFALESRKNVTRCTSVN